jgi:DNA-binding NarL/FixJ family response regulator
MKLGVSGYLTKQCAEKILKFIQAVLTERRIFCNTVREKYSIPQQKKTSK